MVQILRLCNSLYIIDQPGIFPAPGLNPWRETRNRLFELLFGGPWRGLLRRLGGSWRGLNNLVLLRIFQFGNSFGN
jgi:hypothetical protein